MTELVVKDHTSEAPGGGARTSSNVGRHLVAGLAWEPVAILIVFVTAVPATGWRRPASTASTAPEQKLNGLPTRQSVQFLLRHRTNEPHPGTSRIGVEARLHSTSNDHDQRPVARHRRHRLRRRAARSGPAGEIGYRRALPRARAAQTRRAAHGTGTRERVEMNPRRPRRTSRSSPTAAMRGLHAPPTTSCTR